MDVDPELDESKLVAGTRVALRSDSYWLHKILPNKVSVSLITHSILFSDVFVFILIGIL